MPTVKLPPMHFFVPFTRVSENDEERIVEGYAFTQEVVSGEGGKRLKRSTMEAATADYLENGTVRAMHGPVAAGTPLSVEWDTKGALIRAFIADDQEWRKVKSKTYKGFSVGVNALEMRGLDVDKAKWFDSSLVDIGKDTGAKFTFWHAQDATEETDCEVAEEPTPLYIRGDVPELEGMEVEAAVTVLRGLTSSDVPTRENLEGAKHYDCGSEYGCHGHTTKGGATECKENASKDADAQIKYHEDKLKAMKAARRAELGTDEPVAPEVTRIAELETEKSAILTRAETAESELVIERAALSAATERIKELEAMPVRTPPIRNFQALARNVGEPDPAALAQEQARTELQRLKLECQTSTDQNVRQSLVKQMLEISMASGVPM